MPTILFGTNNQFAAKRWPEPDQWVPLVSALGLEYVQFSFDVLDPVLAGDAAEYDRTRRVAEERGIGISSAYTGTIAYYQNLLADPRETARTRAEEWYRAAIEAARRLGARTVGGHIGTMTVRQFEDPELRSAAIAQVRESVLRLSDHASRAGLECLVWEIHQNEREYPAWMEDVGEFVERWAESGSVPIRLCLDLGHACLPGAPEEQRDPYAWLARFGAHARCISLQQTDGVVDRHWPFTDDFNAVGIIEPERVLRAVDAFPPGTVELMFEISFRHDVPNAKVLDDLRASVRYWRPGFDRRGATGSGTGPPPTAA